MEWASGGTDRPSPPASDTAAARFGTPTLEMKSCEVDVIRGRGRMWLPLHASLDDGSVYPGVGVS